MPETERLVETYEVNYRCDDCGQGVMKFTGQEFSVNPPLYQHACSNSKCGKLATFYSRYPVTRHRTKEAPHA